MVKKKSTPKSEERSGNPLALLIILFEFATVFGFTFTGAMMATGAEWYIWLPLIIISYVIFKVSIFLERIWG